MATNFIKKETDGSDYNSHSSLKRRHEAVMDQNKDLLAKNKDLLAENQYLKDKAETIEKLLKIEQSRNKTILSNRRVNYFFCSKFF
jgi:hypothetical protein